MTSSSRSRDAAALFNDYFGLPLPANLAVAAAAAAAHAAAASPAQAQLESPPPYSASATDLRLLASGHAPSFGHSSLGLGLGVYSAAGHDIRGYQQREEGTPQQSEDNGGGDEDALSFAVAPRRRQDEVRTHRRNASLTLGQAASLTPLTARSMPLASSSSVEPNVGAASAMTATMRSRRRASSNLSGSQGMMQDWSWQREQGNEEEETTDDVRSGPDEGGITSGGETLLSHEDDDQDEEGRRLRRAASSSTERRRRKTTRGRRRRGAWPKSDARYRGRLNGEGLLAMAQWMWQRMQDETTVRRFVMRWLLHPLRILAAVPGCIGTFWLLHNAGLLFWRDAGGGLLNHDPLEVTAGKPSALDFLIASLWVRDSRLSLTHSALVYGR